MRGTSHIHLKPMVQKKQQIINKVGIEKASELPQVKT